MVLQRDDILALLLSDVHLACQEECVKQLIWDRQLMEAADDSIAAAGLVSVDQAKCISQ